MIEIISRENEHEEQEIKLPKNIRQVGNPRGRHKIYMEDYVYTYLQNQAKSKQKTAAVLMGNSYTNKDMRYTFIQGAIECGQAMFQFDSIYLDESFWKYICMESQEYFKGGNIVGWFVGEKGEAMRLSPNIESAHRKYFAGRDKVLMLMDAQEEEEIFYVYEQGYLQKRDGYYIYYEKNIAMQEYMIKKRESAPIIEPDSPEEEELWRSPESDRKEETQQQSSEWEELHREISRETEETKETKEKEETCEKMFVKSSIEEPISDAEKALQNYRHIMLEKRGRKVERKNKRFLYTAASFFVIAFVVLGAVTINNYQKVQKVENVLSVMKTGEKEKSDLVVENIPSDVTPLENTEDQQQPDQTGGEQEQSDQQQLEQTQSGQQQSTPTAAEQQQSALTAAEQQQSNPTATGQQQSNQTTTEQQQSAPTATEQQQSDQTTTGQQPQYYVVQAGDTLESICLKLYQDKSKVAALCQANGITNGNQIQAGQKLLLP